jgi:hypothetical protein
MLILTITQWQKFQSVSNYKKQKTSYHYWNHFNIDQLKQLLTVIDVLIKAIKELHLLKVGLPQSDWISLLRRVNVRLQQKSLQKGAREMANLSL